MAYTILRPTAFIDFHAHVLIGEPILTKGKVLLLGRGERPRNFVAARDVAQFIGLALKDDSLVGETIGLGGPENLTTLDVIKIYEQASGTRAKVTKVPISLVRGMSALARPLHPGLSQVLQLAVLADTTDQRFDPAPIQRRFPIRLTSLAEYVAERTDSVRRNSRPA